ncbi:MAG: filamentous hemagglutinin N-terminal domain-containing protein, partial [Cyanobacteria bacterium P01_F01_bin.13]
MTVQDVTDTQMQSFRYLWAFVSKRAMQLAECCVLGMVAMGAIASSQAAAQLIPDSSLPTPSIVVPDSQTLITGGVSQDTALFHSFQTFNVAPSRSVYFANPVGIETIFTRVTGDSVSNIDGVLGVLGNADLFLLNPNGILFGANAQLDVAGSFVATTADSIMFADGTQFGVNLLDNPALITISTPIGVQFGTPSPSPITNSGNLSVPSGQSLVLAGGEIVLDGGSLKASGGRIELISMAEGGLIDLSNSENTFQLAAPAGLARADVLVTDGARVDVSDARGQG